MYSLQRSLSVNPAALAPGHPYPLDASRITCTLHFVEFHGMGPPSPDLGRAGDIYIDLSPRLHALYWCDHASRGRGTQWRRWTALLVDIDANRAPPNKYLVAHPWVRNAEMSDLFLWADPGGVSWISKEALCASRVEMIRRGITPVVPDVKPDVEGLVSQILAQILQRQQPSSSAAVHPSSRHMDVRAMSPLPDFHPRTLEYPNLGPPANSLLFQPPPNPHTPFGGFAPGPPPGFGPTLDSHGGVIPSREELCNKALDRMQRAQKAEQRTKQELRRTTRDLSKLKKQEKDAIGMSYLYQKREQELVAALAAAEHRSSAELQQIQATVQALQIQAQTSREDTHNAVEQVRRSEEELAAIQREIQNLRSQEFR
ncbi:hypothetical protein FB45DRAFT_1054412 [Roridomyces roridus]|uniref:Uncharacterized protein n=1 Tax=Roridomyces roridus TaxID=1738132 RepID=A0AAD7FW35_9AGAR|nr:hypothetical protein FB45DRAFT_1054412 [Roridomyces roridus]